MKEIYFLRPVGKQGPVKIGFAICAAHRLQVCQAWSPVPLEVAATLAVAGDDHSRRRHHALAIERRFHLKYAAHRLHHEWFAANAALSADIESIRLGTFDPSTLPELPLLLTERVLA